MFGKYGLTLRLSTTSRVLPAFLAGVPMFSHDQETRTPTREALATLWRLE